MRYTAIALLFLFFSEACNNHSENNYPRKTAIDRKQQPIECLSDSCRIVKLINYWKRENKNAFIVQEKTKIVHAEDTTEFIYVLTVENEDTVGEGTNLITGFTCFNLLRKCKFDRKGKIVSDALLDTVEIKMKTVNDGGNSFVSMTEIYRNKGPVSLLDQPYGKIVGTIPEKNKILSATRYFVTGWRLMLRSKVSFYLVKYRGKKCWVQLNADLGAKIIPNEGSGGVIYKEEIYLEPAN